MLEAGYDVSPKDLTAFREMIGFSELSDEELELVAGGMGTGTVAGVGAAVSASTVLSAAAAAVAAATV